MKPDKRIKSLPIFLAVVILLFGGCSRPAPADESPQELLSHEISIPKDYRDGDPWPDFGGAAKRYLYAYEGGWWACVGYFAKNINFKVTRGENKGNGWPMEVDGYGRGFADAQIRVAKIIKRFGKEKAQQIFKASLHSPP